jgi:GDP-4-dehydro-6-deoxy-D-mannose reductase
MDVVEAPVAGVEYLPCDLGDPVAVNRALGEIAPDQIYHLAGSFTNIYGKDYSGNVMAAKNLLDAVIQNQLGDTDVLVIGSAAEYGLSSGDDSSIQEEARLAPTSIYGLTKVFQTHLAQAYVRLKELKIMIARPFNIIGKGISNRLFIGRLYEQIQDYLAGKTECICLGGLNGRRDYIDIRDVVAAYAVIMNGGEPGTVYNVGSGELITIEQLLHLFLKQFNVPRDCVRSEAERANGSSASFKADIGRLRALGWEPTIDLATSVRLMYEGTK